MDKKYNMAVIDIGNTGTGSDIFAFGGNTVIETKNSANLSGNIDTITLVVSLAMTGVIVATFSKSGTTFTARDSESIGSLAAGTQTFSVDLNVVAGDYIGLYYATGRHLGRFSSGGSHYRTGDNTNTSGSYNVWDYSLRMSGTGISVAGNSTNFFQTF